MQTQWMLASRLDGVLSQKNSTRLARRAFDGLVDGLFVPALGREGEALARCSRRGDAVNYPALVLTSETLSPRTTSRAHALSTLHDN